MTETGNRSFYSDASHNYMVIACPPGVLDNYQYKMLAANQIRGLLPCSSRCIDNREYLYYDITSRQSLSDLYDRRPVRGTDLQRILEALVRVEKTLTEYLLDTAHLLLEPSCIYIGYSEQECSFVYYPGERQEAGWETLFTFLADRVDGKDKRAAALAYRLCMLAEKPGFRIREQMLEELGLPGAQDVRERRASYSTLPQLSDPFADAVQGTYSGAEERKPAEKNFEHKTGEWEKIVRENGPSCGSSAPAEAGRPPGRTGETGRREKSPRKTGGRTGRKLYIPSGLLIAAGACLFLLDRVYELQEREALLSRVSGGILLAAGLVVFVVYLAGRYREKEAAGPSAAAMEPSEDPALQETEASPFSYEPVYTQREASVRPDSSFGETCLLNSGEGLPGGLYGIGTYRGEQISLAQVPCVVGKMPEYVDQVLEDSSISRMHARFAVDQDGKMTVRDLNSTNGTWLNGERLRPNESRTMLRGDRLRLGGIEFVYR